MLICYIIFDAVAERVQAPVRKTGYVGSSPIRISKMTPKEYILQRLKNLKTKTVDSPTNQEELINLIFKLLMSKKFRKYSPGPEYTEHILSVIKNNVSKNEPIKINLVFGAYKLWRLEEAPEVDWAELFSLIYYTNWLKQVCSIYKSGLWFDFFSDDVIVERMNNVSSEDTQKYLQGFRKLLEFIKPYIPENLNFTLNRVADQYENQEEFEKDLEESIKKVKEELNGKMPILTPQQKATIELNVKLKPDQANDPFWREKVFIIHEGYARISKRRPYYRTSDKIMIALTPIVNSLALGTTKTSVVKYWVGAGVLENRGDSFIENILSFKQLASRKIKEERISIEGLNGKNFKQIKILD